jgi:polysaccharide pyruvyl transferase WcaK-like protein
VETFIQDFYDRCSITTLRDTLSQDVLGDMGLDAPVIPDPSIFARDGLGIEPSEPQYVVLNFMKLGGHFEFGQDLGVDRWEREFVQFYRTLTEHYPVRIVCHNRDEVEQVERVLPNADYFHRAPETAADYLQFYSSARFYVGCRVHGAYATASFGRPAFVIGTDTRARMLAEIGLDYAFVEDVTAQVLMDVCDDLDDQRDEYQTTFQEIKDDAFDAYMDALSVIA